MPIAEYLTSSFVYTVIKDVLGIVTGRKAKKAKADVDSREKWKDKIQSYLHDIRQNSLRDDVIIRDIKRFDLYPEGLDGPGISPWFRLGMLDLYHNGVMFGLRISALIYEETERSWRKAAGDEDAVNAYLVGYIPFRNIVSIDFEGDEYYSYPHFICNFSDKGMPYEYLKYCEKREFSPGRYYFSEMEDESRVTATSLKFGTQSQW